MAAPYGQYGGPTPPFQPTYPQYQHTTAAPGTHSGVAGPATTNVEWYSSGGGGSGQYNPAEYAYSSGGGGMGGGGMGSGGGSYGTFEEDGPLLEELGIDVPAILHRIKSILTFKFHVSDVDSLDLGGPLIFMSILAMAHLLVGKLHFGYILGWTVVGSILLWFLLSNIALSNDDGVPNDEEGNRLDLYSSCSIVGYSLIPLVLHALLSLMFPRRSTVTIVIAICAVLWAAFTASKLFILKSRSLEGQMVVVLFPCTLMYTSFALLTLY